MFKLYGYTTLRTCDIIMITIYSINERVKFMVKTQDLTAQEVIDICATYMNEKHLSFVQKACDFATKAHEPQKRLSGEPFIIHPIQVAGILAQLKMDPDTVATGFLHDVVEDTEYTLDDITNEFSETVAFLVDGVTKLGKVKFQSKAEELAENHRKMLLAMAQDMRVIIVKLADRLHNMRTMEYQTHHKQLEKSQEVLDVYAPLADRLGMSSIKWELEDISLRFINPTAYYDIVRKMDSKREEREAYIQDTIEQIQESLNEFSIQPEIYGRPKHIYSIYRKMIDQKKEFEDIYDLLAIRALVDTVPECYAVLGAVHGRWKPVPGRFKDYIAMPKPNMYQSIHTTVIGPNGKPVEIQIRTYQMHEVAEYGVAAHWAYKEGKTDKVEPSDNIQKQLEWFRELVELEDEASDASEYMDFVKEDIFKDQVYIFTPNGDVMELAKGSCPIDFAYAIHTEVGRKTVGAKVNGRIVPLDYKLKNGDLVEVLTNPNSKPSSDWLKYVATSKARNRIKHYFKEENREQNAEIGRDLIEQELKQNNFTIKNFERQSRERDVLARFRFSSMTDLFAAIGLGELSATTVLNYLKLKEIEPIDKSNEQLIDKQATKQPKRTVHESGVVVEGAENLMIRLSRCCNPVPGDAIIGYITRGRGISVHRQDCPNLLGERELQDRTIEVNWDKPSYLQEDYISELKIDGFDRAGLVNDVLHVVSHTVKNMLSVNGRSNKDSSAQVKVKVEVSNSQQLADLMSKLKDIPDVYSVQRVSG